MEWLAQVKKKKKDKQKTNRNNKAKNASQHNRVYTNP